MLISRRLEIDLKNYLEKGSLPEFTVKQQIGDEENHVLAQNKKHLYEFVRFEIRKYDDIKRDSKLCDWEDNEILRELDLPRQDRHIYPDNELMTSENKSHNIRENNADIQNHGNAIKMEELKNTREILISKQEDPSEWIGFDESFHSREVDLDGRDSEQEDHRTTSPNSAAIYDPKDEVDLYAATLTVKRGDKMKTNLPENIG